MSSERPSRPRATRGPRAGTASPASAPQRTPAPRRTRGGPAAAARRAVSLARALSKLGLASRPEARTLIVAGRVRVGGRIVADPAWRVDLAHDVITVDGQRARPAALQHWMLHKPAGVVTTRRDPHGRRTVYDLLPPDAPYMSAVGRLDLDSSGLLLFTNETQLAAALTDPRSHVEKVYEVRLDAPIDAAAARTLAAGVDVQGRPAQPARVELLGAPPAVRLRITLTEGRNRQVRRMCAAFGCTVVELHRIAVGPLQLGDLAPGTVRRLRAAEVEALRAATGGRSRGVRGRCAS